MLKTTSKKPLSVRDPIHGFVELTAKEREVVNTRAYQRLRDIRQLGMGHMVYPGANHTRFEHCLGVLHVSSRMYDRLVDKADAHLLDFLLSDHETRDRVRQTLRLASLLHDLGHAPFSHSGEHLFVPPHISLDDMTKADRKKRLREYNHERMTAALIRTDEIRKSIEGCGCDVEEVVYVATERDLSEIAEPRRDLDMANALLTGELGSDRCDYLLRDSHHSGQPAGLFDLDRLIHQLTLLEKDGGVYLGLKFGGWIEAEQMIANRYAAYINLYFHKVKRSYEQHLVRFLENALPAGRFPQDAEEFLTWTDSRVLAMMAEHAQSSDKPGYAHAVAITERVHWKVVVRKVVRDRKGIPQEKIEEFANNVREKFGERIFCDILEHSATKIHRPDIDNKILVESPSGVQYLEDLSEIVRGMDDKIWRLRIHTNEEHENAVSHYCSKTWTTLSNAAKATGDEP